MSFLELKLIKKKKIDNKTYMTISKSEINKRIFIDFFTKDGKLRVQKNFPDSGLGEFQSKLFQKQIRSTLDLMTYLGIK